MENMICTIKNTGINEIQMNWKLAFHNLLVETLREASFISEDEYELWLLVEVGLTKEMIAELKESELWVKPIIVA